MSAAPNRPLVVVIDSDRHLAGVLGLLIADWGFSCVTAATAEEAIGSLGAAVAVVRAVIISDPLGVGYPRGDKLGKAFGATAGGHIARIVIHAGDPHEVEGVDYAILHKPFDPNVLKSWLITNIGQSPEITARSTIRRCEPRA